MSAYFPNNQIFHPSGLANTTSPAAAPPGPGKNVAPMQYYMQLIKMGYTPMDAFAAEQQYFGRAAQIKNANQAATAGTIGNILGTVGGAWALNGFKNPFSAAEATSDLGVKMPTILGGEGSLGGAGTGAAETGAGELGAGGAGELGAETGTEAGLGTVALPLAVSAAVGGTVWEDGLHNAFTGKANRKDWTNLGVDALTAAGPNLLLRTLGMRSIGSQMTSGKSSDQKMRDGFRSIMKNTGVADDNYNVTLANGNKFDIGIDGKAKYQNVNGTQRNAWDVDWSNPLAKYATGIIDPKIRSTLGNVITNGKQHPEQYTGMLVNAVTSNAKTEQDVLDNIHALFNESPKQNKPEIFGPKPQASVPPQAPNSSMLPQKNASQSIGDILRQRMGA
jgi:hypothetical protein